MAEEAQTTDLYHREFQYRADPEAFRWAQRPISGKLGSSPLSDSMRETLSPSLTRVYGNELVSVKVRRLVNVALDAGLQRSDDQLRNHILEAMIDGNTPEEIAAIIEQTMVYAGVDPGVRAMTMLIDCVADYEAFRQSGGDTSAPEPEVSGP